MTNKFKIKIYNKISTEGLSLFDQEKYDISSNHLNPDAILLRSHKLQSSEVPMTVKAIARAGAGVNNIPEPYCSEKGITIFNTPGANANAVKELVLCSMFLSSRDILGASSHVKSLNKIIPKNIEKIKSLFKGTELFGKKALVIGLGAIGVAVANALDALGVTVYGFDPFISVKGALGLSSDVKLIDSLSPILSEIDYLTLHMPLTVKTKNFINSSLLNSLSSSVSILNFSRSEIVNHNDMIAFLKNNKIHKYVTDFPHDEFQLLDNAICFPHLGASTAEAEDNCAVMAAQQLIQYLEYGNVKNSVNYPFAESKLNFPYRVEIKHKNVPAMVQKISSQFGEAKINICEMINKGRGDLALTLIDVDSNPEQVVSSLNYCEILSKRLIKN